MVINRLRKEDPTHQCTGYQHQFNVLDQVSPSPTEVNYSTALKHPDKNRGDKYLPGENIACNKLLVLNKSFSSSGNIKGCTEGRTTRLHSCCDSKCEHSHRNFACKEIQFFCRATNNKKPTSLLRILSSQQSETFGRLSQTGSVEWW